MTLTFIYLLISILNVTCCQMHAKSFQKKTVFTNVAPQAGIDFRYTFGDRHYENILESSGSGVTIFDYNNDNLMDVYLLNGTYLPGISDKQGEVYRDSRDKLYRNNGDGTFSDVSKSSGLDDPCWSMAASAVDYDNDGDQDILLLNYGPNRFFRNNGNGTFADITAKLGLEGPEKLNGFVKWSIGASFWDYNRDGRLDVMVGNFLAFDPAYVSVSTPGMMPHPSEYAGQASMLYEQQANGSFADVTRKNNLYYPDSKCMGLTVFDYDSDGHLDIFQANDHQLNFMFRWEGNSYREAGIEIGVAGNSLGKPTGSMHGTIGDVDGDGLIDILVVDLEYGALYRNLGSGLFEDITETSGLARYLTGKGSWSAALFDFDNDGDLDVFSANGTAEELVLQYPLLLENNGRGSFTNSGPERGPYFNTKRSGRGAAIWDYDNDGDLDIIVSHVDLQAEAVLLRNDGGNSGNWLGIMLEGRNNIIPAIGAVVTARCGGRRQVFVNQWATSYLSSHDPRMHIGLGEAQRIDQLEVQWNDGTRDILRNIPVNRYIRIKQGSGIVKQ